MTSADSPGPSAPNNSAARAAGTTAAREQTAPGSDTGISYEDANSVWHNELAHGDDRPQTDVKGKASDQTR
ncbi:hypothetical protein AEAC466_14785 [Asticcacaulis sp. AC466]|nr:hypothetical protein AEAC466_14785 [Asticcacaulis sp. AC466]